MYGSPRKTRAINIVPVPAQALSKMSELQAHHPTTFGHTRSARQAVGASLLMGFKGCGGASIGTRIATGRLARDSAEISAPGARVGILVLN
jgi:hypothetical protein